MAILIVEQHVDIALEFSQSVVVLDRGMMIYNNADAGTPPDRATIENLVSLGG
jgi:branched-chain amino acid transport system ATP-binding protein